MSRNVSIVIGIMLGAAQDQTGTAQDALAIDVMVTVVGTSTVAAVFDLDDVPGLDR